MNRRALAETLALLAAPAVAFWLMHFKPIAQNTFLDPYVYTGYIHNFVDLIERYGVTYYSVRFGSIVPGQIAAALFGPIGGYLVLRYVLALLAGIPFYLLVRQRHGRRPASAVCLLLITSPWLARTLLWDYTDATGVTFFFAAICLFTIEHRARLLLDIGAGVLTGLAVHSNVFVVAPLGIYFGAYTVLWIWFGRGARTIVLRLLAIGAMVAAVTVAGALYYWWRVSRIDIFTITFEMVSELLAGGLAAYRTAGVAWVAVQWWALTPAVLAVLATVACVHRLKGDFYECVIWTSGVATAVFFTAWQFVLNGTVLQLFYYFSYILPTAFLMLGSIVAALVERVPEKARSMSIAALVAAAAGPWIFYSFDVPVAPTFAAHVVIVAAAVGAVFVTTQGKRTEHRGSLVACALLGLMLASCFAANPYLAMTSSRRQPDRVETDVYRAALLFMATIPTLEQRPGAIRFWYNNGGTPGSLNSIQSTYLWEYSKLQRGDKGMPYLGPPELELLHAPGVKWLGLLGTAEDQLAQGRTALIEQGIPHRTLEHHVLTSGSVTLYVELLDLQKGG